MLSDETIIKMYWDRDEQAIVKTDEKYGAYCYAVADRILNNREDSEETVNETWWKTWGSIPPQRPGILRAFLVKITRNLSLDRYRSKNAAKRVGDQMTVALDELAECVSGSEDVESMVEAKRLEEAMAHFVKSLPIRERNIFIRRYFFIESDEEIADKYELSKANVRKILQRTRVKLKNYLVNEGFTL